MRKGNLRYALVCGILFAAASQFATSATPRHFIPLSLSYSWPGGGLSDSTDAQPALGFSLGYQFDLDKHFRIGFRGTWSRMTLGTVDTLDLTNYGLTNIGLMAGVLYRFIKHEFSPYVEVEGGMGYLFADELIANVPRKIDGLSEVKMSAAASLGVLIPVNEKIDIDVSGRYCTVFVGKGFYTMTAHVGLCYALK